MTTSRVRTVVALAALALQVYTAWKIQKESTDV